MPQDHVLIARWLVHATLVYLTTAQKKKRQGQFISEVGESVLVHGGLNA